MVFRIYHLICFLFLTVLSSCSQQTINGVNLVAQPKEVGVEKMLEIKKINASWVSIIPYGYSKGYTSKVSFYMENDKWWGESVKGATKKYIDRTVKQFRKLN